MRMNLDFRRIQMHPGHERSSDGSYSLAFQIDGALEGLGPEPALPRGQRLGPSHL